MLEQLQTAYGQALLNLVFVDFANKKVISSGGLRGLEIELEKEKACRQDLITAINYHFKNGDFDSAIELIDALSESVSYIKRLEDQVKAHRRNKLSEIASKFELEKVSMVSYDANPS